MPTETFTSDTDWTVPSGVTVIDVELEGGQGGGQTTSPGGRVAGTLSVSPGETIYVRLPADGGTGAGDNQPGDAGHSADIRTGGTTLNDRVAVAGGAGGAGYNSSSFEARSGGQGGADTGEDGQDGGFAVDGGTGGTQSSGGVGGTNSNNGTYNADDGGFGYGGDAGGADSSDDLESAGGGGGGWYGGGGGATSTQSTGQGGGGGGGSNYDDGLTSVVANERGTSSRTVRTGRVTISYVVAPSGVTAETVRYRSVDISWDPVSGADSYNIYVDGTQDGSTTSTSYTISGLSPTTTYDITVRTVDDGAESGDSSTISPTTGGDAPTDVSVSINGDSGELAWTDTNGDEDGYEIHRSQSSGVDTSGAPVATTGANAENYQDSGLSDGTQYYWKLVAVRDGERGNDSTEVSGLTALPAPAELTDDASRDMEIDISWTASHDTGDTRVEVSEDDDGTWTVATTVTYDVESATITDLLNGQLYGVRVVADTDDTDTASQSIQATTTLPDEQQPTLGNGVEDEIAVGRDQVSNNGDARYQIRRSEDAPDWSAAGSFQQFIGAFSTTSFEFVGLLDGERYEVRGRTETAYRTGAWTDPVAITTKFPGATGLSVTVVDETAVDIAWTDNADNEDGQRVVRERRRPDGSWGRQRVIDDAGTDTESYIDDTAQPDREFRYRIQPYTPYTSAESNTDSVATPALDGVRDRRIRPTGWHVEVDHPDADQPLEPTVLDGAEWNPRLKAKPKVRIPVPRSTTWEDAAVEGEPIRVWKDGTRLPIEEIRDVEREEGSDGSRDVIVAVGGTKLDEDVSGIEYPEAEAHAAAAEVITEELGWLANVDDPATDAREDVRLFSAFDSAGFTDGIEGPGDPFADTSPLTVFNNEVYAAQTGWFAEAEDADGGGTTNTTQGGEWSGNQAVELTSGDARTFDLDTDYTIPQGELWLSLVYAIPSDTGPGLEVTVDVDGGSEIVVESFGEGGLNPTGGDFDLAKFNVQLTDGNVGDLPPGNHDVEVRIPVSSGGEMLLDFVHMRDERFSYDTDDITPVDGVVTGWQQRPAAIDVVFAPVTSIEQVVAGQVDVEMTDGQGPVALAVRNDQADAWSEATGTTSHAVDFADATQLIQARVTLGRADSGSASGQFGDVPHRLDRIQLFADLVNTPVLIDFVHSGTYEELLNRIADAGDSIWELRLAPDAPEPYRIEWCQPGQRVADAEPTLVSYTGKRTIAGSYQRVIAEGKTTRVDEQTFTTASDYGLNVGLGNAPLETGSETVYDVDDRSTQYERLIDYTLDHDEGALTIIEGGAMEPDTQYQIDYEWRFQGDYEQPGVDDPDTLREQFPGAASNRECEQVALAAVRDLAAPLEEATVTIRETDPDRSLVAAIPADRLPFEGPLKVRDVSSEAREVSLTLGSRESAGDVVGELNDRLTAVARNA